MVVSEIITVNSRELLHQYSDEGRYLIRDGVIYTDAVDPIDSGRTYTEGEIMEDVENPDEATEDDCIEALRDLGVEL